MRPRCTVFAFLATVFGLALPQAYATPVITFSLDSNIGYGAPAGSPDPDTCLPSNCVLFTGTSTDFGDSATDMAGFYYSFDAVSFPYTADAPAFSEFSDTWILYFAAWPDECGDPDLRFRWRYRKMCIPGPFLN